jgi:hypothetical protein
LTTNAARAPRPGVYVRTSSSRTAAVCPVDARRVRHSPGSVTERAR